MVETAKGKLIVISPILKESLITLRIVDHLSGVISPIFFEDIDENDFCEGFSLDKIIRLLF